MRLSVNCLIVRRGGGGAIVIIILWRLVIRRETVSKENLGVEERGRGGHREGVSEKNR